MRIIIAAVLPALLAPPAFAASMNKCVDAQGHVTFTQQACPGGGAGEAINVKSQSSGMLIGQPSPVASESLEAGDSSGGSAPVRVTVVGGVESTPCGEVSPEKVRTAIVREQVFPGMNAEQAIQAWGKPNKVNRSSRGTDQWVYYRGSVSAQYLYVDAKGCVTAWN